MSFYDEVKKLQYGILRKPPYGKVLNILNERAKATEQDLEKMKGKVEDLSR